MKLDSNGNYVLNSNGNKIEWHLGELIQELFGKKSGFAIHAKNEVYSKEFRHPVLHGRKMDYNDSKNSAMLVMMLYTLIEKAKNETKNTTKNSFKSFDP